MHRSSRRLCELLQPQSAGSSGLHHKAEMDDSTTDALQGETSGNGRFGGTPLSRFTGSPPVPRATDDVGDLVRSAACGNRPAWNALVDRFSTSIWAVARAHRLSYADAADVCQTTWMRLVEHLDRIEQPERVGAWLATTARRESLRLIRLAGRQVPAGEDMDDVSDACPPPVYRDEAASKQLERVLDGLLTQLPVKSQLLLRLLLADTPLSYKDISEALGMPLGSIGPTRARALDQLRRRAVVAGVDLRDLRAG